MKFQVVDWAGLPHPVFYEEPELRKGLLSGLILDMAHQEDLYLAELAKGEAGETILDLYNNCVHLYIYPDLVVLEDMYDHSLGDDEECEGPPASSFFKPAEIKQLILDWLDAKKQWYAERRRLAAN